MKIRILFFCLIGFIACKKESIVNENNQSTRLAIPQLNTSLVNNITSNSAISGGQNITFIGNGILQKGVCWATTLNPTIANSKTLEGVGANNFVSNIAGLLPFTTYHVRAYATTAGGTGYGEDLTFNTAGVVDADGNVYSTVQIGNQVWISENLRATKFRNRDLITLANNVVTWSSRNNNPKYCAYANNNNNFKTYGYLYDGKAATDVRNIAPIGYHVATKSDWTTLVTYLGGLQAYGKLKEIGTIHWFAPNTGASNSSGFTALPGGYRNPNGSYSNITKKGYWWESDALTTPFFLTYNNNQFFKGPLNDRYGFSIRCVKD